MHVYMRTGNISASRKTWVVTIRENPSARAALVNVPVLWEVKKFTSSVAYVFLWVKDNTDELDARLFVVHNERDLANLDSGMVVSPSDERVGWFENVIDSDDDLRSVSNAARDVGIGHERMIVLKIVLKAILILASYSIFRSIYQESTAR